MGGIVCQIMAGPGAPCQMCQSSPHFDTLTQCQSVKMSKFRTRRGPSVSKSPKKGRRSCQCWSSAMSNFGAPRGPCQSSGRAGAPVSNLQKKVVARVNVGRRSVKVWSAPRPVSKFRPRRGPPVSKVSVRVSKFWAPGGPCVKVLTVCETTLPFK